MKKFLLILFLLSVSLTRAQTPITLNFSDIGAPTKTYLYIVDTAVVPSITPGPEGANVTWNYAALHTNHDTVTLKLVPASSLPPHNLFPNANMATIYDSSVNIQFLNSSVKGIAFHGIIADFFGNGDSLRLVLSIPDTVLSLPATYGDFDLRYSHGKTKTRTYHLFYDTLGFQIPIDSIYIIHHQWKITEIDGWGTMILPNNSFPALRIKDSAVSIDSLYGYVDASFLPPPYNSYTGWHLLTVHPDTTVAYSWWMKAYGVPVVKMNMIKLGSNYVIKNVEWAANTHLGITENNTINKAVYPNPANDYIIISSEQPLSEIIVYDALGNEVIRKTTNSNKVQLNIQHLPNGLYMYNAIGKNNTTSGKFIVKH